MSLPEATFISPFLRRLFSGGPRQKVAPPAPTRTSARSSSGSRRAQSRRAGSAGRSGFSLTTASTVGNAIGVNQAVVKITREGRTKGGNSLKNQLQYIGRSGDIDLQGQGGEIFDPEENGRYGELVEDWQRDFDTMDKRATFATYHLVVSYPRGTDPTAARLASDAFAQELTGGDFGDRWKYAVAHHRDTDFPHAHIVLNRVGLNGRTLQINRDSITIQDLRELHVETAEQYGIALNATSRFSRNVEDRPRSSGRIQAERQGRELEPIAIEPTPTNVFPFHGASKRQTPKIDILSKAKQELARHYDETAEIIDSFADNENSVQTNNLVAHLKIAATRTRQNMPLIKDISIMTDQAPSNSNTTVVEKPVDAPAQAPEKQSKAEAKRELEKLQRGVMALYKKSRENIERTPDEATKTEAELALARVMKSYDPFLSDKNRRDLGLGIERDKIGDVDIQDRDASRQRRAALDEAKKPDPIQKKQDVDQETRAEPTKGETLSDKALKRLDRADKDVYSYFASKGIDAKLALQRVRDAPDVDKETRQKWADRDIEALARSSNTSESDARAVYTRAFRDASRIYAKARDDIHDIKRGPDPTRTEGVSRAQTQARERAVDRTRTQSRDRDDGISR